GPVLVGPADAEREVGTPAPEHLVERPLEEAPAAEPIVVVAEPVNAVRAGELRLLVAHLRDPEVVEPELGRQVGLVVALEPRPGRGDVRPLGEARAPPPVILRDRMELRQVEGDQPDLLRIGHHPLRSAPRPGRRPPPPVDARGRGRRAAPRLAWPASRRCAPTPSTADSRDGASPRRDRGATGSRPARRSTCASARLPGRRGGVDAPRAVAAAPPSDHPPRGGHPWSCSS